MDDKILTCRLIKGERMIPRADWERRKAVVTVLAKCGKDRE